MLIFLTNHLYQKNFTFIILSLLFLLSLQIKKNSSLVKKHHIILLSLFLIGIFSIRQDVFSQSETTDNEEMIIFDERQSDLICYLKTTNTDSIIPELQNSLQSPSFRLLNSQKKTQQNPINNILLRRFNFEAQPTKSYNIKFSFPLSSKEDLIVIVRHLII